MRRIAIAVLLLLGACTNEASQVTDEPTPTPAAQAGYTDEWVEWYLRSISEDGKTIAIVYTMSGVSSECQKEGHVEVDEADHRVVRVVAFKQVTTDRNRACTEELGYVEATATLKAPLGDRTLSGCKPNTDYVGDSSPCRDLERSRDAGIFEFSPPPSPSSS